MFCYCCRCDPPSHNGRRAELCLVSLQLCAATLHGAMAVLERTQTREYYYDDDAITRVLAEQI
jgi:hypothetical protein